MYGARVTRVLRFMQNLGRVIIIAYGAYTWSNCEHCDTAFLQITQNAVLLTVDVVYAIALFILAVRKKE